jgi:hypothetical protein
MWAPLGVLPYVGVDVPPSISARSDALVRKVPLARRLFVNQRIVARKPGA